jgi:UbiD family decarboxylase
MLIELVRCETNDLLVLSDAEIILKGMIWKDKALP